MLSLDIVLLNTSNALQKPSAAMRDAGRAAAISGGRPGLLKYLHSPEELIN
jgi:hypothetical protein